MMRWVKLVLFLTGLMNLLAAVALLLAPAWFYEHIGYFPPYNRHYIGDAGAFALPWGLALCIAAFNPPRHRLLIGLSALASILHSLNHLYDHRNWSETLMLLGSAALLLFVWKGVPVDGSASASTPDR